MTSHQQLIAYLATLGAIVLLVIGAMLIGAVNPLVLSKTEAFGLGMAVGGLVGVLRIPSLRSPVASTENGDVTVNKEPAA